MSGRIVVVGCGAQKRPVPSPAGELYVGSYFRSCYRAAEAVAPAGRIFILSALYGLVRPSEVLPPYDVRLTDPEAVDGLDIKHQAHELGVAGEPVLALCPGAYADLLREVFADVRAPLAGLGIGQQRGVLARLRRGEAA